MLKLSALAVMQVAAVSMRAEADVRLNQFMSLSSTERNQIISQIKNEEQVDTKWGFLKNIVNIDRFFSSGADTPRRQPTAQELRRQREQEARDAAAAAARRAADAARAAEERRKREAADEIKRNKAKARAAARKAEIERKRA